MTGGGGGGGGSAAGAALPRGFSRAAALARPAHASTGDEALDAMLGGGLRRGAITELAGESTAGKTQVSLQVSAATALAGGAALCCYSEHDFQSSRLAQIAGGLAARGFCDGTRACAATLPFAEEEGSGDTAALRRRAAEKILLQRVDTPDDVLRALRAALPLAERSAKAERSGAAPPAPLKAYLRLVVVASIAAPVREEYENTARDMRLRAETLFRISTVLRTMAHKCGLAVLVTNHVSDVMDRADARAAAAGLALVRGERSGAGVGGPGALCAPALGLTWAHCVHVRLFASRTGRTHREPLVNATVNAAGGATGTEHPVRKLQVVFAPYLPRSECHYVIEASGVRGVRVDTCLRAPCVS